MSSVRVGRWLARAAHVATVVLAGVLGLATAAGCDKAPPPDGLREWSAADHDGEKGTPKANQGAKGDAGGVPALVEIAWRNQCAACHGASGKADGPQAAMFKPRDLTQEDWQAGVKDEDIAGAITNGKGRMPKFELEPEIVRGLVARVRSFRGR